jgi:hypothetical protein
MAPRQNTDTAEALRLLHEAGAFGISARALADALYGGRPGGGPLDADANIWVIMHRLRCRHGVSIVSERVYRIEPRRGRPKAGT